MRSSKKKDFLKCTVSSINMLFYTFQGRAMIYKNISDKEPTFIKKSDHTPEFNFGKNYLFYHIRYIFKHIN